MADVQPFYGLRYNLERIGDLSAVITPPYDVISTEEQLIYYRSSPHNVIRLEYGEERPDDSPQNNRYTRAALTLENWLSQGMLTREQRPAFYLVEHRFTYQGSMRSRFSLLARVRLEPLSGDGGIRPHEMTMRKPGEDRLCLLQSCRANFSPVMGLFQHRGEGVQSLFPDTMDRPALSAVDRNGVTYAMWVITDEEDTARVSDFFTNKTLYIADGHHRYETALAYQKEQLSQHKACTGDEAFNFVMMTLTSAGDPNLIMLPTHRLVRGVNPGRLAQLKRERSAHFDEEFLPPSSTPTQTLEAWMQTLNEQLVTAFGLYGLDGDYLCLLRARPGIIPTIQPDILQHLDVNVLHQVILRQMLGIDSPEREEECLEYTRDGLEAISRVDAGEYQLAILLNPTPISSVMAVADQGVRMPQKSTYFHPKTPTGLVINPLWDDLSQSADPK